MSRIDEINNAMLEEFRLNNIPDTDEHRAIFLEGLKDGWEEDGTEGLTSEQRIERTMYIMALNAEIFRLKITSLLPQ